MVSIRSKIESHFNLNHLRARLSKAVIESFERSFNAVDVQALNSNEANLFG